jgi:EmrB/QacA subfamily drug resistance transporter
VATVLGSGMVLLDGTAVNVALPTIGGQLAASIGDLQWIVSGYTLALAGLILLGGSLGDRLGRRRVFLIGVVWFALASALCGLSPGIVVLIAARVAQGAGGALLVPGSLAIIQASFDPADRPRAIGAWSGLGGIAAAIGPLLGGWLVVSAGWRWVFLLNLPVAAWVVAVAVRHVPESRDAGADRGFDVLGALLAALGLGGITFALIGGSAGRLPIGLAGLAAACAFFAVQWRRGRPAAAGPAPMLPLRIFRSRQFSAINVITFCVYGAFGGMLFLLVLQLQEGAGFSALAAGASLLPVTVLMLILSPRTAALAHRTGPRWPMTCGLLLCAAGVLAMRRIGTSASYLADVLPAAVLYGIGLSLTVAPLTAAVLAGAEVRHAGIASGVNNAVARAAGLLAVAGLPAIIGLHAAGYHSPALLTASFREAMVICACLLAVAACLTAALVREVHDQPPAGLGRAEQEDPHRQLGPHPEADRRHPLERAGTPDLAERGEAGHVDQVDPVGVEPAARRAAQRDGDLGAAAHLEHPA